MKTKMNILIVLVTVAFCTADTVRYTVTGKQCVFPFTFEGKSYSNCITDSSGSEFCFTDPMGVNYENCSSGAFASSNPLLLKTPFEKGFLCLFEAGSAVLAVNCDELTENTDKLDSFLWFWVGNSEIKSKFSTKCVVPIKSPLLNALKTKVSYSGYLKLAECSDSTLHKWHLDDSNRVINDLNKKCFLREDSPSAEFKGKKAFKVNIVDCLGTKEDFASRDYFIPVEYSERSLELMNLSKLVGIYLEQEKQVSENTKTISQSEIKLLEAKNQITKVNSEIAKIEGLLDSLQESKKEEEVLVGAQIKIGTEVYIAPEISVFEGKIKIFDSVALSNGQKIYSYLDLTQSEAVEMLFYIQNETEFKFAINTKSSFTLHLDNKKLLLAKSGAFYESETINYPKFSFISVRISKFDSLDSFELKLTKNKILPSLRKIGLSRLDNSTRVKQGTSYTKQCLPEEEECASLIKSNKLPSIGGDVVKSKEDSSTLHNSLNFPVGLTELSLVLKEDKTAIESLLQRNFTHTKLESKAKDPVLLFKQTYLKKGEMVVTDVKIVCNASSDSPFKRRLMHLKSESAKVDKLVDAYNNLTIWVLKQKLASNLKEAVIVDYLTLSPVKSLVNSTFNKVYCKTDRGVLEARFSYKRVLEENKTVIADCLLGIDFFAPLVEGNKVVADCVCSAELAGEESICRLNAN